MGKRVILSFAAFFLFASCNLSGPERKPKSYAGKASNPNPADGAKGVSPDTKLNWIGDPCASSYNVYFGMESPPAFVVNQTGTTFDPGPLDWDQTYYWRIETVGGAEGDMWMFTTFWYGDPNAEEMDVRVYDKEADERKET